MGNGKVGEEGERGGKEKWSGVPHPKQKSSCATGLAADNPRHRGCIMNK